MVGMLLYGTKLSRPLAANSDFDNGGCGDCVQQMVLGVYTCFAMFCMYRWPHQCSGIGFMAVSSGRRQ